jgi:curved DNA-binding protein CbpA
MRSHLPIERPGVSWDARTHDDSRPDLYRILGLHPSASDKKIKAAYRKLAKRFHPDANASDTASDQFKEINRAYQVLGNSVAREAYDAELAIERVEARGRFWRGVAAGVVTFVLTASTSSLVALLILHSTLSRPEIGERAIPAQNESVAAKLPERDSAYPSGWARPDLPSSDVPDKRTTTPPSQSEPTSEQAVQQQPSAQSEVGHVKSPEDKARTSDELAAQPRPLLVPTPREEVAGPSTTVPSATPPVPAEERHPRTGAVENPPTPRIVDNQQSAPTVSTAQRVTPHLWRLHLNARSGFTLKYPADAFPLARTDENKDRLLTSKDGRAVLHIFSITNGATTLPAYRQSLIAERYADASFDYTPQRRNQFVLSGMVRDEMFYEHVTLSCDHRSIHGWVLVYPRAERAFYDAIGAEIRASYRDPKARCSGLKS